MKKIVSIFLVITLILILGCSKNKNASKVKLSLYTSVDEGSIKAIEEEFERNYPNIDLEPFRMGTSKIIAKINTEIKAGKVNADLLWTSDPAYFESLKRDGLILPYIAPVDSAVLQTFVDPEGYYVGARVLSIGLMYNTNLVSEEEAPKDWEDLLDPKWKDQIVQANPLYSGAATATAAGLSQKYGWQYYEKLRQNGAVLIKGNPGATRKVAGGEYKVGIGLDYTVRQMAQVGSPIKFVYPNSGSIAWGSPIAILKTTKHAKESKIFVDFILSLDGQKFLAQEQIVSVNTKVPPPPNTPHVKEIMENSVDFNTKLLANYSSGKNLYEVK